MSMELNTVSEKDQLLAGVTTDPELELKFKGPFDEPVTVPLQIKNLSTKKCVYKIEVSKKFSVKPSSGIIKPGQSIKTKSK